MDHISLWTGQRQGRGSPQLYYHNCLGRIPGHTTREPQVGFEQETNGFQFYAIANLDQRHLDEQVQLWPLSSNCLKIDSASTRRESYIDPAQKVGVGGLLGHDATLARTSRQFKLMSDDGAHVSLDWAKTSG